MAGLGLARLHPEAQFFFTRSSGAFRDGFGGRQSGASVAEVFWTELGIKDAMFERASRHIAENAGATVALIGPRSGETRVWLISAFHMPRALQSLRRAGWARHEVLARGFPQRPLRRGFGWDLDGKLDRIRIASNEYLGLIGYHLAGN